jgi:hypothetical protein
VYDSIIPGTATGSQSVAGGEIPNIILNDTKLVVESETKPNDPKTKLWMDFEDFFICFK